MKEVKLDYICTIGTHAVVLDYKGYEVVKDHCACVIMAILTDEQRSAIERGQCFSPAQILKLLKYSHLKVINSQLDRYNESFKDGLDKE